MKKELTTTILTIQEAIDVSIHLLTRGAAPFIVKRALMGDGFAENKADTILRWAMQTKEYV